MQTIIPSQKKWIPDLDEDESHNDRLVNHFSARTSLRAGIQVSQRGACHCTLKKRRRMRKRLGNSLDLAFPVTIDGDFLFTISDGYMFIVKPFMPLTRTPFTA
jgi:hypothetical protein